ncbi:TonB-dependent receptor [uncultured Draconibacterium sp.]|uniref:TonB-dependent receptor n=1 Tax=uncultured Draconibacterium sp. TaxID=1573823 RepID=UPI0029C7B449|nr:TonB-dependent receptor [uncultured Draconibacterium sp.]
MAKLTTLFLLISFMQISAKVYSQSGKLDLEIKNATIREVFEEIEDNSKYRFFYDDDQTDLNREVTVKVKNNEISKVLTIVLDETNLTWEVKDNLILIQSKDGVIRNETDVQQKVITGKVSDDNGEPLPGVTVMVKGTSKGTVSSFDGTFSLASVLDGDVLVFSFIGMRTQEIRYANQMSFDVVMLVDAIGLEEVVAIGYGTQKKANLTGSTSIVESEDLIKRPVVRGESLLQGRVAGLNIEQNSGQPGDEGFTVRLRGIGSFGNSSPFVLVDGIESSLSQINPADIENITVLKDAASAAIYGSRAANGVILVTTKRGRKEQAITEATVEIGVQNATRLPDYIYNSVEYMQMWNKGAEHSDISTRYPQEMIDAYRNAAPGDPRYPNYNWLDKMYNPALRQNYQLSFSGGGKKNTYFVNLGYVNQDGIIDGYGLKQYSGRFNLDIELNDYINVGTNTGIIYKDTEEPYAESQTEMILYINTMPPTMSPYLSDGTGRFPSRDIPEIWRNRNPQMVLDNAGGTNYDQYIITPQAYINIEPFKGLSWKTTGAWRYDLTRKLHTMYPTDGYVFTTNKFYSEFETYTEGVYRNNWWSSNLYLNSVINYETTIGESHNLSAVLGYEQQTMNYETMYIHRPEYSSVTTTDIDAGNSEDQSVSGFTSQWALQSYFGRIAYDYKGKYLVEGNIRYDGTSKIAAANRWDLFPSMSLGWRISDESFMESLGWIDNLKMRASAGQLGNQNSLSDYPYQRTLSYVNYPINGSLQSGVVGNDMGNDNLVWEVLTSYNVGLDYSMQKGLFGFELDVYKRITENGISTAQIPASVGKNAPQDNYKEMENTGIEIMLKHSNKIGEFRYDVSAIFDKYNNKITKIRDDYWGLRSEVEGHPLGEWWLLDWTGIYQNQSEIDNLPMYEPFRSQTKPGDLIFRDTNGDGEITVEPETGDKVFMAGRHPKFSYSFNLNMEWKNFDMSAFFQGIAGKKIWSRYYGWDPFAQGGPPTTMWRNAWDGEGSTNSMPALYNWSGYSYKPIDGQTNDFFLHDASYFRLKNLQIGYNLPAAVCKKIGISRLRTYISGDNLFTISEYEGDPERGTSSSHYSVYPQLKTYSLGLNLTF